MLYILYPVFRARGVRAGRAGHVRGDGERDQHDVLYRLDPRTPGLHHLETQQQPHLLPGAPAWGLHHHRQGGHHHGAASHHVRQVRNGQCDLYDSKIHLSIFRSSDSGVYTCVPDNAPSTNVTLHVLTGDFLEPFTK